MMTKMHREMRSRVANDTLHAHRMTDQPTHYGKNGTRKNVDLIRRIKSLGRRSNDFFSSAIAFSAFFFYGKNVWVAYFTNDDDDDHDRCNRTSRS